MTFLKAVRMTMLAGFLLAGTACRQDLAEREVNKRINNHKASALTCLDTERVTRAELTAFFNYKPVIPYWKNLQNAQRSLPAISNEAESFSTNDKVRHCYAGYKTRERYSHRMSLFIAFYKESSDVGDCRARTHFEIEDQVATILGSRYAHTGQPLSKCLDVVNALDRQTELFLAKREEALKLHRDLTKKYDQWLASYTE